MVAKTLNPPKAATKPAAKASMKPARNPTPLMITLDGSTPIDAQLMSPAMMIGLRANLASRTNNWAPGVHNIPLRINVTSPAAKATRAPRKKV